METTERGMVRVVAPGEEPTHWQPVPANGYAGVKLVGRELGARTDFSLGIQVVAPGGHIRQHSHDRNEEVFLVLAGSGRVVVDGETHALVPEAAVFLGVNRVHTIINDGPGELRVMWLLMPGGLETFFAAIGRPRRAGEPAPAPFPRPADVREIEARTVFAAPVPVA